MLGRLPARRTGPGEHLEGGTMKRRMVWLILVGLSVACTPAITPPASTIASQRQPNFAFHFEYGACLVETLDTFNSTFTHDMGTSEPAITISLELTPEQMEAIYQRMVAIGFFSYPEAFARPTPASGSVEIVTPANHYSIRVQNGDTIKTVTWTDDILEPTTQEADRLRQLFQMIIALIEEYPDIKELPVPAVGCV
jgi:hypothetical protein